jgi:uncharacterized protein YkwD
MILVTAAILTVQSQSSMLQSSYAQSCPDGSPVDASGNCATMPPPPAGDGETTQAQSCPEGSPVDASGNCATLPPPPAGDGETAQAPPATETTDDGSFAVTPPPATEAPPATTETPPPATETPPAGTSQVSNNTGNAYCESCNNDIYNGGGDLKSMVLAVHNRERAAVGVPALVWNDDIAATAQIYANYLWSTGKFEHRTTEYLTTHPNDSAVWGENLAARHGAPTTVPIAQNMQGWVAEKNVFQGLPSATGTNVVGHYTQMVWNSTKEVGCATATGNNYDVLVCRYSPPGNTGGNPY